MTGLQAPEEAKEIAVPPHERLGTHNRQELAPFDEWREENERNSRGVVGAPRSDLAFDVTGKLFSEKEVFGCQFSTGPEHQPHEAQQVSEKGYRRSRHVW